jgi:ethanolamine utilization protein EutA
MARTIKLVGLDCGSTTTSAVVAQARLAEGAIGRVEITQIEPTFLSPLVLTPFAGSQIDAHRLERYVDDWLTEARVDATDIFGGGALVTGLAAEQTNAEAFVKLIEARLADSVIATARDPCLESWLAFMGNCHALSTSHPDICFVNLDIGGGTTNLAVGVGGQVLATSCLMVGARHFQFDPGTYRLKQVSGYGSSLLEHLQIRRSVGDMLDTSQVDRIVDWYVELIDAAITGRDEVLNTDIARLHVQVPLRWPAAIGGPVSLTLSGGVGQLAYAYRPGGRRAGATEFGDLGGELAEHLIGSALGQQIGDWTPEGLGRATVYGLLRHATELSGTTLYLAHPERLPLRDVPIVGKIGPESGDDQLGAALQLAARASRAACLQIDLTQQDAGRAKQLGERLASAIEMHAFPRDRTLVLLVPANVGKVLGGYVTRWGSLDVDLVVADEVPLRDAQFVRLGRMCDATLPVSLYGMR